MKLLNKLGTIYKIPIADKWLFAEAVVTSAYIRFTLSFLPFKKVMAWLGKPNEEQENTTPVPEHLIKQVQQAVRRCNKYTPWKTECYTQALTGKILLQRRHIASVLFIGFRKDEDNAYKGHAWLKANDVFVTGYMPGLEKYQVNAFFC